MPCRTKTRRGCAAIVGDPFPDDCVTDKHRARNYSGRTKVLTKERARCRCWGTRFIDWPENSTSGTSQTLTDYKHQRSLYCTGVSGGGRAKVKQTTHCCGTGHRMLCTIGTPYVLFRFDVWV